MTLRRTSQLVGELRTAIRGGRGCGRWIEVVCPGEMIGVRAVAILELEAGASIGEHQHSDSEELYLVLAGEGVGSLDGEKFPVGPGDAWVCQSGHSHGLEVGPHAPLRLLAVLS